MSKILRLNRTFYGIETLVVLGLSVVVIGLNRTFYGIETYQTFQHRRETNRLNRTFYGIETGDMRLTQDAEYVLIVPFMELKRTMRPSTSSPWAS